MERALERVCTYVRERYPDVTLILDAKRGDIGSTAAAYARATLSALAGTSTELARTVAALALGLKQATRLTQQIGQTVGLDQLAITGDGGDSTALVAGKQINSRVYARYTYGVFSRVGALLLRYRLSEHLTLEAGVGETQSIDILYTIERD